MNMYFCIPVARTPSIFQSKHNSILSIMHVATRFDSKGHHRTNRGTISEVHKVTEHILGSQNAYEGYHY